jgi:hypothetical protein
MSHLEARGEPRRRRRRASRLVVASAALLVLDCVLLGTLLIGHPALVGVREPGVLEVLPAAERAEWLALWKKVDTILNRATSRDWPMRRFERKPS